MKVEYRVVKLDGEDMLEIKEQGERKHAKYHFLHGMTVKQYVLAFHCGMIFAGLDVEEFVEVK